MQFSSSTEKRLRADNVGHTFFAKCHAAEDAAWSDSHEKY